MKPYGSDQEKGDERESPDKADIAALGLSSKHGKSKSKTRRGSRRVLKKKERKATQKDIENRTNEIEEITRALSSGRLDERHYYKLSTTGKLFIAGVAAWLIGQKTRLKIKGSREEIEKLATAMVASKKFQHELGRDGATAQTVIQKLGLKNATAKDFERMTGIPWPM